MGIAWITSSTPSTVVRTTASSAIGSDDEPAFRVLASIFDDQSMVNGMKDVLVGDAVSARRLVEFHAELVYYEKLDSAGSDRVRIAFGDPGATRRGAREAV